MDKSDLVLGIDLGTSNTAAVALGGDLKAPTPIVGGRNKSVMPSVVSFKNRQMPVVGWSAKDMMLTDPLTTVFGWKRFVGRQERSEYVSRYRDRLPFRIHENDRRLLGAMIENEIVPFTQVAMIVLQEVRLQASAQLGRAVKECVISVPAHFMQSQREAVLEAAKGAGLNVLQLVNEPTAAAITFGIDKGLDTRILIYDLGGGTFDATILEIVDDVFDVKATGGEAFLGGIDFDRAVMTQLVEKCKADHKIDPMHDAVIAQRFLGAAEYAKCLLSEREEVDIHIPMIGFDHKGDEADLQMRLSRADLERLTAPLIEQTIGVVEKMLQDVGLTKNEIDHVIIVGGQSRMPLVLRRITEVLGKEPFQHMNPDTCVAAGAALLAKSQGFVTGAVLMDVLAIPIGLMLPGGHTLIAFNANTKLPATYELPLGSEPPPSDLTIGFWQGTDVASGDRQLLGIVRLPKYLFESGIEFRLSIKLHEDLHIDAYFQSSAHQNLLIPMENPA